MGKIIETIAEAKEERRKLQLRLDSLNAKHGALVAFYGETEPHKSQYERSRQSLESGIAACDALIVL